MKKNTLYSLDTISKYSIYSKLNSNYDKILGERSLKGFVKVNKKPKILKRKNILEEFHQRFPNEENHKERKDPQEFINKLIIKKLEMNKNDNSNSAANNKNYKIFKSLPNNNPQKLSMKNYFFSNKNKNKHQEVISLDPFKYNPNYEVIFKKVPYVHIGEPKEKNNNRDNSSKNKEKNKENKKNRQKSYLTSVASSIDNTNENLNESNPISGNNNSINSIKLPNISNNKRNYKKDNHTLRFSKYGNQRKSDYENKNENEAFLRQEKHSNNSISVDQINMKKIISVNFNKMMSRRETDFVNNYALNNPSFNRYSPNYDFVKITPAKISFSYHNLDNNDIDKKKYLLRKLISSYNIVDSEYHIVNNKQIKNNTSSKSID